MRNQFLGGKAQDPLAAARLLSGVMALGVVTFAAVVVLLISSALGEPLGLDALPPPAVTALVVLAAAVLVAAPLVERMLLRKGGRQGYVSAKIVGMALRELPGILGGLLGLLTGELLWAVALPAASVVAIALGWPRASEMAAAGGEMPGETRGETPGETLGETPGEPPRTGPPIEPR